MNETMSRQEVTMRMKAKERVMMTKWIDFPSLVSNPDALTPSPNQLFTLSAFQRLQALDKSRQIGQSMGFCIDSQLRSINEPGSNSVHVSTDKWESEKKQKYVLRAFDCMYNAAKEGIRIVSEAKNHIEIEAKDDEGIRSISSIDFLACRPPRGADKASIYLHEGAHMPNIGEIIKASIGCTSHAGYIRMCGTHQGKDTLFYKIINNLPDDKNKHPYANWRIGHFPWWTFPPFCKNVEEAIALAPGMETEERVYRFGTWALIDLFESQSYDDFREEYECICLDENYSFYPDTLIKQCQPKTEHDMAVFWFEQVTCTTKDGVQPAIDLINFLLGQIYSGNCPGQWLWAADLGRRKDTTEITIGQKMPFGNILVPRAIITLDRIPGPQQERVFRHMLDNMPISKGFIDASGMGLLFSEALFLDYGQKCMPLTFTNALKSEIANGTKIRMQKGGVIIPIYPALTKQIHSIKKKVTLGNNETYDPELNNEHHGDKFWSFGMFCLLVDPIEMNNETFIPTVIQREPAAFSRIVTATGQPALPSGVSRPWTGSGRGLGGGAPRGARSGRN